MLAMTAKQKLLFLLTSACLVCVANSAVERVFTAGVAGISCFRIPAIVQTANGTLLAFAEARHGSCGDGAVHEIVTRRSTDGGKTWQSIAVVVGSARDVVGNPYPIAMKSGKVALVYVNHTGGHGADLGGGNGVVFSSDDGQTWTAPIDVSESFGKARGSLPGPGAGIQLASGRLLVVSHHGAYSRDYIAYSDDEGQSWATVNVSFPKMDEATLADLGGGQVLLNMRHQQEPLRGRAVARSKDGGLSWSNVSYDSKLFGPVCQGSLATISGNLYFSNPASHTTRSHLTVRRSDDGGHTWNSQLEIQAERSAGYSSLLEGRIGVSNFGGILYESGAKGCVDFASFPLNLQTASIAV
eukprot:TRINITY_DN31339_c0_g1_i1.p1 TRINITY_DN31339_c0_g1~~TRINITY_DN31339_c0_g1_i1.p1  ORF type:complete len:355 (-),score=31.64 TRINITY_DN31339_c0_g1_i1:70-1134(-)